MEKNSGNNNKDAIVKIPVLRLRAEVLQPDIDTKLKDTFIVALWAKIFDWLQWISLFHWVHNLYLHITGKTLKAFWVEAWVLGNFVLSCICLSLLSEPQLKPWQIVILIYAGCRILEIIVYQTNLLLFDAHRTGRAPVVKGFIRLVLLVLHNYIEIIVWFAVVYRNLYCLFDTEHISLNSIWGALYFSIVTMSTLGYGDITPRENLGLFLVIMQTIIGIFVLLCILARFIALLPKPRAVDEF